MPGAYHVAVAARAGRAARGLFARPGVVVSAIAHAAMLFLLVQTAVHPFAAPQTQSVTVDIVSARELEQRANHGTPGKAETQPAAAEPGKAAETAPAGEDGPMKPLEMGRPPDGEPARPAQPASPKTTPDGSAAVPPTQVKAEPASQTASPRPIPAVALPPAPVQEVQAPLERAKSSDSVASAADEPLPNQESTPGEPEPQTSSTQPSPEPPAKAAQPAKPEQPANKPARPSTDPRWFDVMADLPAILPNSPAPKPTKLPPEVMAMLRRHLHKCWSAPAGVNPSESSVVIRVFLQPNGAFAREPMLMAARASSSGPLMVQAAMRALRQCAPYAFLPAQDYKEWKVLDLPFTAGGMSGG